MNRSTRSVCLALGALAISAAPAVACVNVGRLPGQARLDAARAAEEGGQERQDRLDLPDRRPRDRSQARSSSRARRASRLIISWLPDKGTDSVKAPGFRLSAIAAGKFDPDLKALALQIKALPHGAIVRPMPDPNTPWYAWSGTVNGNRPGDYVHGLEARAQGADEDRGQEGQAALERVRAQRAGRPRRTRSRCTSRAPSRSTSSAPTPTTSATRRASPGRPRPTCSRRPTAPSRSSREEAVLDLRDRLHRHAAATRAPGSARSDSCGKTMPKLAGVVWYDVTRQHRRLPRAAHGRGREPRSRRSSRRVQVRHPQP